jgi:hypothetical protein
MIGVAIGTSVLGRESCDPEFEPLYEEMNRRGAVVFGRPPLSDFTGAPAPSIRDP